MTDLTLDYFIFEHSTLTYTIDNLNIIPQLKYFAVYYFQFIIAINYYCFITTTDLYVRITRLFIHQ